MGEDMRGNFWEPENNLLLDLDCSYIGSEFHQYVQLMICLLFIMYVIQQRSLLEKAIQKPNKLINESSNSI